MLVLQTAPIQPLLHMDGYRVNQDLAESDEKTIHLSGCQYYPDGNMKIHQRSRRTSGRIAIELGAATLLLLLPALGNGYPLVFPDTGAYLVGAIEHLNIPDRPPYYSFLILAMHFKVSLWPVIVMQSLAVATALRLILYSTIPTARSLHYLIVTAVLTAFSSVGWHADQIMPDVFTGLLAIVVFLIAWAWKDYGRPVQVALVLTACGITTLHYTHLPLSIGLFAVATLLRLALGAGWQRCDVSP